MIKLIKRQLIKGACLPIYTDYKQCDIFEDFAILDELLEKDTEDTLFIGKEEVYINKEGVKTIRSYYYNYQKWKVTFKNKFNSYTTIRKISFFVKRDHEPIE